MSVLAKKSWHDIRRRRARSLFTVVTVAFAVAGVSLFSMPPLMDRAVEARIEQDQLHDVRFTTGDVVLDDDDLAAIADVEGVRGVEVRTVFPTRLRLGDRREDVVLVGVVDSGSQAVNVVTVDAGDAAGPGEAVTDAQNRRSGRFDGGIGTTVQVEDLGGELHPLTIAGEGDTLWFSGLATNVVVLYVAQETVAALADAQGVSSIELTVDDPLAGEAVAEAVRARLLELEPTIVFEDLPDVRAAGTWPGQEEFDNFGMLFYVGAILALVSAMVLISNTMTTMVAEQVREVAIVKAIGGRRRQILRSFLRTVVLIAGAGSLLGVLIGVPAANVLVRVIGGQFFGLEPEWGVDVPVVVLSVAIGVVGSVLAALPALRRAMRISVREGLDTRSGIGASGRLDRALRRAPLPPNARLGLRNMARRRARTFGTLLQIGLAVGVALGFLTLGVTIATVTGDTWDVMTWDVVAFQRSSAAIDDDATAALEGLPGVEVGHPVHLNTMDVGGRQVEAWGLPTDTPLFSPDVIEGRWLEADDEGRRVAVVGRALASRVGLSAGDVVTVGTARGPAELEVVGVDGRLLNNASTVYLPLTTFQDLLGRDDTNAYWLRSTDQDEAAIDRLAAEAEDRLAASGHPVGTAIHYVERNANLAANDVLVKVLGMMGVPIVAIGMIGLVNLITMNVIERTREIGVLRCIGASARDIRRVFRTEALAIAVLGWLLAVPLGWAIGSTLVWVVTELFDFGAVGYEFPLWYLPAALVVTLALAAVVVVAPVRRAAHLRPGDALRYE